MKETMAENYTLSSLQEDGDNDDEEANRLSFCNILPTDENYSGGSTHRSPKKSSDDLEDQLFEFFAGTAAATAHKDIVFCGKIIYQEEEEDDQLNEYEKRDYFSTTKSQTFPRSSYSLHNPTTTTAAAAAAGRRRFSASSRVSGGDLDYHVQRVNITSLTSMSAKSKRRMFMFGPVKFKPEMDLSAIKQRQGRRAADTAKAEKKAPPIYGEESECGVVAPPRSPKGRSQLTNMLARSFGCFPVGGSGGRWIGVAN